jgi:cell division protein FtsB
LGVKEQWHNFADSRFARVIRNKYLIAAAIFVVWITFFDSNNLIDWSKVVLNISEQESQKKYYKLEIKSIEEKLNELTSNRDSLEKFAREQYMFKEDSEDLFIVVPKK